MWKTATKTKAGLELDAKLAASGEGLKITAAKVSDQKADGDSDQTDLSGTKHDAQLGQPYTTEDREQTVFQVTLTNEAVAEGFTAKQVGLYANENVLYMICQDETGTAIPAKEDSPGFSVDWFFYLKGDLAESVTVSVETSGRLTREEAEARYGLKTDLTNVKTECEKHNHDATVHVTSADKTKWNAVENKAEKTHTHLYAGSDTAGGKAKTAATADKVEHKLTITQAGANSKSFDGASAQTVDVTAKGIGALAVYNLADCGGVSASDDLMATYEKVMKKQKEVSPGSYKPILVTQWINQLNSTQGIQSAIMAKAKKDCQSAPDTGYFGYLQMIVFADTIHCTFEIYSSGRVFSWTYSTINSQKTESEMTTVYHTLSKEEIDKTYAKKKDCESTYYKKSDTVANATKATQDASGNVITNTYAKKKDCESTYYKKSDTVANATKATQDASGNVITDTYAKKTDCESTYAKTTIVGEALSKKLDSAKIKVVQTGRLTSKDGAFAYKDSFLASDVIALVTPNYISGNVFNYTVTAQTVTGQINIYARKTDGTLCPDGTTGTFNILMLKP